MEYKKFLRMSPDVFDELLNLIKEDFTRQNTHMRESIPSISGSPKYRGAIYSGGVRCYIYKTRR